ncbi:killer cell lectin-like receptor subfamily B member 1C [Alligator mississippiensis]|uniref:killer cell lectin-like receptor subfamily B member 1C n=1 Tax=Alligator mississippiensis TaxID=8496 RepID=UPI0028775EEA|nr:killer cell lectin-like receptor subfamily B member 1C [Alligator mississippiensis]
MGESVTYAELQFSKAPLGRSVSPQAQGEDWQQGEHLEQDQAELMRMQQEGNCSQTKLQKMRGELEHAQQLVQKLQQQLDRAQATVQSCQVTDCCLETWMLHGGKCLFLSKEEKTWDQSKRECEVKSSRLLILQDWDHGTMLSFLAHTDTPYWIGLRFTWDYKSRMQQWQWEDGTPYNPPGSRTRDGVFGTIRGGRIERGGWYYDKHRWVCERPAGCPQGTAGTDPRA